LGGHLRIGGEFEARVYRTEVYDVDDVGIQSYIFRPQAHYVFLPGRITPYLGMGLSLHINVWDVDRIEDERPGLDIDGSTSSSGGIMGVAGLEVPLGDHFSIFAEARADASVQFTQECTTAIINGFFVEVCDDVDSSQLGGATGMLGVRYQF
jgi:hypothetical protein